jgi:RHS repeat-associated protein
LSGTVGGAGGIGGLVGMRGYAGSGTNYCVRTDGKGNITEVRQSNTVVVATYAYAPFGAVLTNTGSYIQPFRFQTKIAHARSGLGYWGYRWFDTRTGQWLTRDPLAEAGGLNLYQYCDNNPVNAVDPMGLRIRLLGTPQEQQQLLSLMQQFVRGQLGAGKGGLVYRKRCPQDEAYDDMISDVIASKNYYDILLVDAAGTGSGSFTAGGAGGTIKLSRTVNDPYVGIRNWMPVPGQKETQASILSHELARAYAHAQNEPNTQIDRSVLSDDAIRQLGLKAVERSNPMRERMSMLPRWGYP